MSRLLAIVLLLGSLAAGAAGQEASPTDEQAAQRAPQRVLPASGAMAEDGAGAWLVLPSDAGWGALAHLPPRTAGAADGEIRWVRRLERAPEALVAIDSEVHAIFSPLVAEGGRRRVGWLATDLTDGTWRDKPAGRLAVRRSVPPAAAVLDAAAGGERPLALLEGGEGRWLARSGAGATDPWTALELPAAARDSTLRIVASADGPRLLESRAGGSMVLWLASAAPEERPPRWEARPLPTIGGGGELVVAFEAPTGLVLVLHEGSDVRLTLLRGEAVVELATVSVGGAPLAVAPLVCDGRIALVIAPNDDEADADPADGSGMNDQEAGEAEEPAADARTRRRPRPPRIVEISLLSGRLLYDGPASFPMPVTRTDLRALGAAMLLVIMLVLAFLLAREANGEEAPLPEGYAIVEDGRRIAAGVLDVLVAAWLASLASGTSIWAALGAGLLSPGEPLLPLLLTVAIGFLLGVLGEAFTGRSPGKALAGCRVVAAGRKERAIGLLRALVRNACKWAMPPLALMAFLDPDRRHRGDALAGTLVVSRVEDEPQDE